MERRFVVELKAMAGQKKKMLLHMCCAPCAVYVVEQLRADYDVTGFFYNPNIQPKKEYDFRVVEVKKIAERLGWDVIVGDYDMKEWFAAVKGLEHEPERGKRCSVCFRIRLRKTFELARDRGFDIVTSTLSISPYKATKQINAEGEALSKEFGIEFLPENFKKQNGFNIGKKMAMDLGIQHQNYCGCVFSKVEKILRERQKTT